MTYLGVILIKLFKFGVKNFRFKGVRLTSLFNFKSKLNRLGGKQTHRYAVSQCPLYYFLIEHIIGLCLI